MLEEPVLLWVINLDHFMQLIQHNNNLKKNNNNLLFIPILILNDHKFFVTEHCMWFRCVCLPRASLLVLVPSLLRHVAGLFLNNVHLFCFDTSLVLISNLINYTPVCMAVCETLY